ncbi:hypothetical protein [Natronomonas sp. LN261]|uniref:hypothetical protein n=1 Tax=Natronomonas sp. LN261 TaxID=2750669 RepID=UPI0015EE9938|nr:hypothetical protein [Natronomonas sp. LN261]
MDSADRWYTDDTKRNSFLGYRYVIDGVDIPEWIYAVTGDSIDVASTAALLSRGKQALETAFDRSLADVEPDAVHVVPLSAGYDSRTILAELIERVDPADIRCVTYGTPGGFNYEIAPRVAKAAGVDHHRIDLTPGEYDWTVDGLIREARTQATPSSLFGDNGVLQSFFEEVDAATETPCYLWSGYLGGESGGAHLDPSVESWADAIDSFLELNYQHDNLTAPEFDPRSVLPDEPLCDPATLRYEEQLDYGIRQQHYIDTHTDPHEKTPFTDPAWLHFAFNIPDEMRVGQDVYERLLLERHPSLFELPTARTNGLPITAPAWRQKLQWLRKVVLPYGIQQLSVDLRHPALMHFDKNNALRHNPQLRSLVEELLASLDRRGLVKWVDIDRLLPRHRRPLNFKNYGWELLVLASLEIHIRSIERQTD